MRLQDKIKHQTIARDPWRKTKEKALGSAPATATA